MERGMDDALARAFAFTKAGADGIMIHSRKKRILPKCFEFVEKVPCKGQNNTYCCCSNIL